ncbi:MAG: undecaprenyl-phosphate glucose phosphotransferase [Planctomycetes bacterium]|nr:undecaprenyl-phosphate glucose phosphotransferase [Planctomycetota bacterium]
MKRALHSAKTANAFADFFSLVIAWAAAYGVRFHATKLLAGSWEGFSLFRFCKHMKLLPIVLIVYMVAYGLCGLYRWNRTTLSIMRFIRLLEASCVAWLAMVAALYYYSRYTFSRGMLLSFLVICPFTVFLSRELVDSLLKSIYQKDKWIRKIAILGTGRLARRILNTVQQEISSPCKVEYLLTLDPEELSETLLGKPIKGWVGDVEKCLEENSVDVVLVALSAENMQRLGEFLNELGKLPVQVGFVPDVSGILTVDLEVIELDSLPIIQIYGRPVTGLSAFVKRSLDLVGATSMLLVMGFPMVLVALIIKLTSKGPIIYRQKRMGLGGDVFKMHKFRTMRPDAEADSGPIFASEKDARRTRFGSFLRRFSIDELPQLFNVIKGDMSLVGPRPERPHFVRRFSRALPSYMLRHKVKAGITGWAQIHGLRGKTSIQKRLQYDLHYINHWSFTLDFLILLVTPLAVLFHKHAY